MKRHYYLIDNLDQLDRIEDELEHQGVVRPQIHVLSNDDGSVETHPHLHNIESILKQDVVHGTIIGALLGVIGAALIIAIGLLTGLPQTYTWTPFYFLAAAVFGFITWSGGFYGIQTPHKSFRRFQKALKKGQHVFIVDVDPTQESIIKQMENNHPELQPSGVGSATPRWIVMGQQTFKDITSTTFP
jgi:hypothetical protein